MNFKLLLLYIIGFLVYTQGYWERFTLINIQGILEVCIWLLTLIYFRPKNIKSVVLFFVLLIWGWATSLYTNTTIDYFKYIRYLIYTFIVIDIFQQTRITVFQGKRLIGFVVLLLILQGVAAYIQLNFLGGQVEGYVGMMSSLGGTTATAFPVFVTALVVVVFCYSNSFPSYWYILLSVLLLASFLVGYSSGKRAIYFYIPSIIVLSIIVSYYIAYKHKVRLGVNKLLWVAGASILLTPLYFYGVSHSAGYSQALKGGESNSQVLEVMFDYAEDYENAESGKATIGRSNSSQVLLTHAMNNARFFWAGSGYLTSKNEDTTYNYGVSYGFVGFSRDLFAGGAIYCLLTMIFIIHLIFRHDDANNDAFSIAMRISICVVFLLIHLFYSSDFTTSLKLNFLLAIVLSIINSNNYYSLKQYYNKYLKNDEPTE